jgi:hypothetical protein
MCQYIDTKWVPMARCGFVTFIQVLDTAWGVVPVMFAVFAIRPVSTRELSRFSDLYGVKITNEILPTVTKSVRWSRAAKLAGAAIGFSLYNVLFGLGVTIPSDGLIYGVVGYLLGAFVTGLIPLHKESGVRKASLVPRLPRDYLPRIALVAPILPVAASALAILAYELEPRPELVTFSGSVVGLPVAAVAVAATYVAIRIVVSRPQPITSPGFTAIDDALRTQAVHTLSGAGLAIAFLGMATCMFAMAGHSSFEWLRITGVVLGIVALAGMGAAWGFRRAEWHVRRVVST